jgi:hypothetical protein
MVVRVIQQQETVTVQEVLLGLTVRISVRMGSMGKIVVRHASVKMMESATK